MNGAAGFLKICCGLEAGFGCVQLWFSIATTKTFIRGRHDTRSQLTFHLYHHDLLGGTLQPNLPSTLQVPHASEHVRSPYWMAGAVAVAWLGMYVHNVADLPDLTL